MKTRLRNRRGFSVIELAMVIALAGILSSIVAPLIVMAIQTMMYDQIRYEAVDAARYAVERSVRETARIYSPDGIVSATPQAYEFMHTNRSRCLGDSPLWPMFGGRVGFRTSGEDMLDMVECNTSSPLADQVEEFQFTYLGADGLPLAVPVAQIYAYTNIRTVRIEALFSDPDLGLTFDYPYRIMTEVRPRNLRTEKETFP